MKKPLNTVLYICITLIAILIISALVWGKTLKMEEANRLLASQPEQAKMIYEQMAAGSPESPYLLNNLGLAFYKESHYDKSIANLSNARKKIESPESRENKSLQNNLANNVGYNLGNALFKQVEKTTGEQGNNVYQSALDSYKKAIIANRNDLDAKYNYELTKLRLKQIQQSQSSQKSENQNQKDQQPNQSNSSKNKSEKQDNPNKQSQSQNSSTQPGKGQMTKEQAEELLKMMKSQDQSKAPIISVHDGEPKQDW